MAPPLTSCLIWGGEDTASGIPLYPEGTARVDKSPRAGGGYIAPWPSALLKNLTVQQKARLTTWLVDQREHGVMLPLITPKVIEDAIKSRPLPVHERADRLLRLIAQKTGSVGQNVYIPNEDPASLAWTESTEWSEVAYCHKYLKDMGLIQGTNFQGLKFQDTVTVDGYARIADQATNVDSTQAFVAMWFDESMNTVFDNGIKPAIEEVGYTPFRIDRKEYLNKIDDEIIAEIRRSRYLVADFTQGPDGARGGVYYESGFAHGLGLPVIFTCRQEAVEKLHFDTSHYNHIVWTDPVDLREKLKNRIRAVIGQGPVDWTEGVSNPGS